MNLLDFFPFETGPYYVAQTGLKLLTLQPQPSKVLGL
jgi:hypothetical protein